MDIEYKINVMQIKYANDVWEDGKVHSNFLERNFVGKRFRKMVFWRLDGLLIKHKEYTVYS